MPLTLIPPAQIFTQLQDHNPPAFFMSPLGYLIGILPPAWPTWNFDHSL